ncbi:DNA primase small subunit [Tanacetum coccineum]
MLFPHEDMSKWMSYGNDGKHPACDQSYFGRREFSFTLDNDVYLRFQSFKDGSDLKRGIKEYCPFKIDIGPVYNVDPSKRHAYATSGDNIFAPVERELVFDIDISDYDDARYCCSGADVCLDCWPLMTIAIKVVDTALRDDFGFNHILWVYSGRRGVHCWVCDGKARRLNNEQRSAIADYFRVYKGNSNSRSKVSLIGSALHPFLARAYEDVLKGFFVEKLLGSQELLSDERYEKILDMIPDECMRNYFALVLLKCMSNEICKYYFQELFIKVRSYLAATTSELRGKWQNHSRSSGGRDVNVMRWEQLKNACVKHKTFGTRRAVEEIVFSFTYPRLDMEVSKHMNHLLKAPFCVHPKTGRVCVPINPDVCDEFDPTNVPTLSKLMREINTGGLQAEGEDVWERTSMWDSVRYFRESFLQPLLKSCKVADNLQFIYVLKMAIGFL